jgi:hypothetical protein
MATGNVTSALVPTIELNEGDQVILDHERYTVHGWEFKEHTMDLVVGLEPQFGPTWYLEVASHDAQEPIWERI